MHFETDGRQCTKCGWIGQLGDCGLIREPESDLDLVTCYQIVVCPVCSSEELTEYEEDT